MGATFRIVALSGGRGRVENGAVTMVPGTRLYQPAGGAVRASRVLRTRLIRLKTEKAPGTESAGESEAINLPVDRADDGGAAIGKPTTRLWGRGESLPCHVPTPPVLDPLLDCS
jgi:hypothetical protein